MSEPQRVHVEGTETALQDPTRAIRIRESDALLTINDALGVDAAVIDVTETALTIRSDVSFEEWQIIGHALCRASARLQWKVGDWWVFGSEQYGERAEQVRELFGDEDDEYVDSRNKTFRNLGRVARAFEPSRRRDDLSFSHHEAVAALDTAEQDQLLEEAKSSGWSVRRLRDEVRIRRPAIDVGDVEEIDDEGAEREVGDEDDVAEIVSDVDDDGDIDAAAEDDAAAHEDEDDADEGRRPRRTAEAMDLIREAISALESGPRHPEKTSVLRGLRALDGFNQSCNCDDGEECEHRRIFESALRSALTDYTASYTNTIDDAEEE